MARELVAKIGLNGHISTTVKWEVKDSNGLSIARMVIDDLAQYAKIKAEEYDTTYDVSVDDGEHELLIIGRAFEHEFDVYLDGEKVTDWKLRANGRFELIASFIGFNL